VNDILTTQLGLPKAEAMGSMFGSISFGGRFALPVIKGNLSVRHRADQLESVCVSKYNYSGGSPRCPGARPDLRHRRQSNNPSINPTR